MVKLLIISGPTATGKTTLAVKIAKKYHGELVSADSRQIYKGLDIGVGKDHPKDTPIHMIDLINPDQSFSVAQYRQQALNVINFLHNQGKLPILVGCSGFYIDSIINPNYNTFSVKPNFFLRKLLFRLPLCASQIILRIIDYNAYLKLNNSDLHNPLRLIRKIEIKLSTKTVTPPLSSNRGLGGDFDILHLSLTASNTFLYQRIDARVESRITMGHLNELKELLKKYKWSDPGLKVSAYFSFKEYLNNKKTMSDSIQRWKYQEHRDARRQKTWLKKRKNIMFIDITKKDYYKKAEKIINQWYNKM